MKKSFKLLVCKTQEFKLCKTSLQTKFGTAGEKRLPEDKANRELKLVEINQ